MDALDYRRALHIFRLRRDTVPEVLCRRVLQLTGTGIQYPSVPRDLVGTLEIWAMALGTQGPEWYDDGWEVAIVDTVVRHASREAARLTVEHAGTDKAAGLARLLVPVAGDRSPAVVLSALGYRTLGRLVRTVDAGEDRAQLVHDYEERRGIGYEADYYSEMEAHTVGMFRGEDAPAEWETATDDIEPAG